MKQFFTFDVQAALDLAEHPESQLAWQICFNLPPAGGFLSLELLTSARKLPGSSRVWSIKQIQGLNSQIAQIEVCSLPR